MVKRSGQPAGVQIWLKYLLTFRHWSNDLTLPFFSCFTCETEIIKVSTAYSVMTVKSMYTCGTFTKIFVLSIKQKRISDKDSRLVIASGEGRGNGMH